jgi:hypothetical protein
VLGGRCPRAGCPWCPSQRGKGRFNRAWQCFLWWRRGSLLWVLAWCIHSFEAHSLRTKSEYIHRSVISGSAHFSSLSLLVRLENPAKAAWEKELHPLLASLAPRRPGKLSPKWPRKLPPKWLSRAIVKRAPTVGTVCLATELDERACLYVRRPVL